MSGDGDGCNTSSNESVLSGDGNDSNTSTTTQSWAEDNDHVAHLVEYADEGHPDITLLREQFLRALIFRAWHRYLLAPLPTWHRYLPWHRYRAWHRCLCQVL